MTQIRLCLLCRSSDLRHPAADLHTEVLPFIAKTNVSLRTPSKRKSLSVSKNTSLFTFLYIDQSMYSYLHSFLWISLLFIGLWLPFSDANIEACLRYTTLSFLISGHIAFVQMISRFKLRADSSWYDWTDSWLAICDCSFLILDFVISGYGFIICQCSCVILYSGLFFSLMVDMWWISDRHVLMIDSLIVVLDIWFITVDCLLANRRIWSLNRDYCLLVSGYESLIVESSCFILDLWFFS